MALKGLDIFKLTPKKNCKECGSPTCMAFAMKVAQGALPITKCPYMSDEAIALVGSLDWDYLNGIAGAGSWFYRDEWRRSNRGFEHSLMTTGENLMKAAEKKGITTTMEDVDYGFHFTAEPMTTGEDASEEVIDRVFKNFCVGK